jgi:hypothetical protein
MKASLWRPQVVDQAERRRLSAAMSGGVPRPVPLNDFLEAYKRYKPKMWVEAPETVKTKGLLGKTVGLPHILIRSHAVIDQTMVAYQRSLVTSKVTHVSKTRLLLPNGS